jgi:hypothetical protein
MMGRVTLREVRKALAAARVRGADAAATGPTVEELESLVRVLERQAAVRRTATPAGGEPAKKPHVKRVAEQGAAPDGGGRRRARRSARPGRPRR